MLTEAWWEDWLRRIITALVVFLTVSTPIAFILTFSKQSQSELLWTSFIAAIIGAPLFLYWTERTSKKPVINGDVEPIREYHGIASNTFMHQRQQTPGNQQDKIITYYNRGDTFRTQGDLDQAEAMYRQALALNEALGNQVGIAADYNKLGIVYQSRGDLDQAEDWYHKALEIVEALDDREGIAANYNNLGIVYQSRGDLDQAKDMYHKALEIVEALDDREGIAISYNNLGTVYLRLGDLHKAEAMYHQAVVLLQQIGAVPQMQQVQELLHRLRVHIGSRGVPRRFLLSRRKYFK